MKKNKIEEKIRKEVIKELTFKNYYIPPQIMELFKKELLKAQEETKKEIAQKLELLNVKWGCSFLDGEEFKVLEDLENLRKELLKKQ